MSPKRKKIIIATALIFCWFVFDSLIVFAFTSNATKDQLNANITFQRQTIERWPLLFPNQLEVRRGFWDKIRRALFMNKDAKRLYSDRYRSALTFYENSKGLLHQAETSFQHADYPNATEYLRLTINSLLAADLLYGSAHEVWNGNLVDAQKTLYTICHNVNSVVAGKAFGGIAGIVGNPALGLAINIEMESGIKNVCNDQFSVSKRNLKDVIITSISTMGTKIVGNLFGKAIERTIEVIEKLPLVSKVIAPSFSERKQPDEIVDDFLRREELFKDFSSGNGTTVVNKTQEQLSNSTTSQQPPSMAMNKQEQLRQAEEAKKKQAEEEKKRLEAERQKQEDQRKIEEQRRAQAVAEEALKKAKTANEQKIAKEARKKAEEARIAAEQGSAPPAEARLVIKVTPPVSLSQGKITALVVDQFGTPVGNAKFWIVDAYGKNVNYCGYTWRYTNENGRLEFPDPPDYYGKECKLTPGNYTLHLEKKYYDKLELSLDVPVAGLWLDKVVVKKHSVINGLVMNESDQPVYQAKFWLTDPQGRQVVESVGGITTTGTGYTTQTGRLETIPVPDGQYTLNITCSLHCFFGEQSALKDDLYAKWAKTLQIEIKGSDIWLDKITLIREK